MTLGVAKEVAAALARDAVEDAHATAPRRAVSLSAPDSAVIPGDPQQLPQVLANLLNNAAKYTEEGGRIALEVTRVGEEAVFRVRDNGIGISPEMVASVFDLFTQVDR